MKIILDTDKKTITVPYNYAEKLEATNKIIAEYGGDISGNTFTGYLNKVWNEAMKNSDTAIRTASAPVRKKATK